MKQTKLIPLLGLGFTLFLSKPHMIYGNATFGGGDGTENNPYQLSTPTHLTELQVAVDGGNSFSGKHFILTNDIDFAGYDNDSNPNNGNFNPIGEFGEYSQSPFSGNLDGRGHAIKNLSIKENDDSVLGLFSYVYEANIENLHLKEINMEGQLTSGLSAYAMNSTISQVTVKGDLIGGAVGGIITGSQFSNIEDSSFEGTIKSNEMQTGGIAGATIGSTIQDCQIEGTIQGKEYVGGVIGMMMGGSVSNTNVDGSVLGDGAVGGLVGVIQSEGAISNSHIKGNVTGEGMAGGSIGAILGNTEVELSKLSVQGDVIGDDFTGGLIGINKSGMLNTIQKCFVDGDIEGGNNTGGLIGYQAGPLNLSNSYVLGTTTGETTVGGIIGLFHDLPEAFASTSNSFIQNSYHHTIVSGTDNVGQLIGKLGGGEEINGIDVEGYVAFENVYVSETLNQTTPMVGTIFMGDILTEDVLLLQNHQMTQNNAKHYMPTLDFEDIWTTTSTTPMFRWQNDLISANEGEVQINGSVEAMVADITIPSVSPDLVINPNLSEGFVAPEFSVSNDSVSPIKLELKTFEQTTNTFNDVLPSKYSSWEGLNKHQSQDIALGLVAKEGEGWQTLTTPTSYVAGHSEHEIGIIKPTSSVDFSFDVKHGTSFSEAKTVQYKMVFVFDLLN